MSFLRDVACQKLLNSANVSRSYSQNNTGTVFWRHGVFISDWSELSRVLLRVLCHISLHLRVVYRRL